MKKGLLELCILNILDRRSMYGYQLVKVLRHVPGLVVTEGTIYPLMGRLKKDGLLTTTFKESPNGPVRKNYELSAAGKKRLREINSMWKDVSLAVDALILHGKTLDTAVSEGNIP
ncbi:MAG: PadR family transcriptional regulator [Planctomycetes bacterium]|nr:PadR family transcriptional regulator [Planctomycetota bacterium]